MSQAKKEIYDRCCTIICTYDGRNDPIVSKLKQL